MIMKLNDHMYDNGDDDDDADCDNQDQYHHVFRHRRSPDYNRHRYHK